MADSNVIGVFTAVDDTQARVGNDPNTVCAPAVPFVPLAAEHDGISLGQDAAQVDDVDTAHGAQIDVVADTEDTQVEEDNGENPLGEGLSEGTGDFVHDDDVDLDGETDLAQGDVPAIQLTDDDLLDARERAELSLLARIFWVEPRELRVVENSFLQVWKCGRVRIFDVGSGLFQFVFPSVIKRDWVLASQPWFFQRSIIHFTDILEPSEELFHSLQFMPIWVKIIGLPFAFLTIVVGRKLLAKLGEVLKIGYFDAGTPEGSYVKGRVRMDLLDSFLGTAPVTRPNGTTFPVFFQYIGVPCICYLCGFLGHVMADCSHTEVVFDEHVRSDWMCGKVAPNEQEREGPQLQLLPPVQPQNPSGRGGLPPSVAAGLSSNLNRQWARERVAGGLRGRGGAAFGGLRPPLAILGTAPHRGQGRGGQTNEAGSLGSRIQVVRPLRIMAPGHGDSAGNQMTGGPRQVRMAHSQGQQESAASAIGGSGGPAHSMGRPAHQQAPKAPSLDIGRLRAGSEVRPWPSGGARLTQSAVAPFRSSKPVEAKAGRPSGSLLPAQATPQSKLLAAPSSNKSRRSTPSSGSAKRKLLEAFDLADGPPSPADAGPGPARAPPAIPHGETRAAGSSLILDQALLDQQPAGVCLVSNSDTNFDPDTLFVSGSEEGENSKSGSAEEPTEVEVANPNRPPINQ
ncbi:hypothetical protein LINPERPRIM_LOCUS20927 [Linum perenne]